MARALEDPTLVTNGVIAMLVRAHRRRAGISLSALASVSGVSLATLERLEHTRAGCSAVDLWRIALALDVSISDLCTSVQTERTAPPPRSFLAQDASDPDRDAARKDRSSSPLRRPAAQRH